MKDNTQASIYKRIETEIENYISNKVEISPNVFFSQYQTINRIMKFVNRDLSGTKINSDLTYDYYFDIISPRVDSEVKNLRFDTKHILVFSRSPRNDFPVVFVSNAMLKSWLADNGEDLKLKSSVEEFSGMGNVIFKKIEGGYERCDPLNTYITNQRAETIDDTDIIERHEMTASQIKRMSAWDSDAVDSVIKDLGNKTFTSSKLTTPIESTGKRYEVYEFTGEVSEKEFNELNEEEGGDEHTYFLAKIIVAGLEDTGKGKKYCLFSEKLNGLLSDHYQDSHRGKYEGRFWRVGLYELLFDHQIRCNEIGNQLSRGLEWASKVVFRSKDSRVLQNIRADLDNGDVVITEDLAQVDVRMQNMDQLIADWNRIQLDADKLSNSFEVVRGEAPPSGTPFRSTALMDSNAGKMFTLLRQKITLPYKRVFREWVLPELIKDLSGQEIFRFVGDEDMLDQLREVMVNSWYIDNLVKIGPHTRDIALAIKAEKMDDLRKSDPIIENSSDLWKGVKDRLFVTITGENSDMTDNIQDMVELMQLEQDPSRLAFLLDTIYKMRGIPVPPLPQQGPSETQIMGQQENMEQKSNPQVKTREQVKVKE